ncbi:unnamed protein product [Haemonchus placei]|uniref:Uncharacterized protein n=1 Tax=Haemonchus placei TaxID=6290 RepID=A0A3P8ARC6_HAEPC|nr:unnamed protein product [Haemonchus placei]
MVLSFLLELFFSLLLVLIELSCRLRKTDRFDPV